MASRKSAFIEGGGGRKRPDYMIDPSTGKKMYWADSKKKTGDNMQRIASNRTREKEIGNELGKILLSGKVKVGDKKSFWGDFKNEPESIKEGLAKDFGGRSKDSKPKTISSSKKKKSGGLMGAIKRRLGI